MVGALDQQTSEVCVAGMGDAELRIMISGLTTPRSQAQVATHIATSSEPFLAAEGQHEGQGGEVADAVNLQQCLSLGILGLAELLDLPVVLLDLDCHLRDLLEHWTERLCQSRRHNGQAALSEARCSGGRHTIAAGLRQTTNGVHRSRAQSHQQSSRTDQGEGLLLCDGTVGDRPQYVRIKPGITRQLLGIDLVALPIAVRDRSQLAHVRHDDFMAELLQLFADPDRVRSSLHRNPRWRYIGEPLLDRLRGGPEAATVDHFSVMVEGAVMAPDVAKVDADRDLNLSLSAWDFRDEALRWLLHGKQSLSDPEDLLIPFIQKQNEDDRALIDLWFTRATKVLALLIAAISLGVGLFGWKTLADANATAKSQAAEVASSEAAKIATPVAQQAATAAANEAATAEVKRIMEDPRIQKLVHDTAAQLFREGAYKETVEKSVHNQMQTAIADGVVGNYTVSVNGIPNQALRIDKKVSPK